MVTGFILPTFECLMWFLFSIQTFTFILEPVLFCGLFMSKIELRPLYLPGTITLWVRGMPPPTHVPFYWATVSLYQINESKDSNGYISICVHGTAVLFTVSKVEQTKCPSAEVWREKTWYMNMQKYYPVFKRNEILSRLDNSAGKALTADSDCLRRPTE